jgi:hypothetical protein
VGKNRNHKKSRWQKTVPQVRQRQRTDRLSPDNLRFHIHANGTDATYANSDLTDAVNLQLKYDHELFHASPHHVGHVLTSFGLTERKRTNTGGFFCSAEIPGSGFISYFVVLCTRARQLSEPRGLHFVHGLEKPAIGREQIRRRTTENYAVE